MLYPFWSLLIETTNDFEVLEGFYPAIIEPTKYTYLIHDENDVVVIADLPQAWQEAWRRRQEAAFPLDGLNDDGCGVSWSTALLKQPRDSLQGSIAALPGIVVLKRGYVWSNLQSITESLRIHCRDLCIPLTYKELYKHAGATATISPTEHAACKRSCNFILTPFTEGQVVAKYLVPFSSICSCLSGFAVQAVGVRAGQHPWKERPKACSIVGLGVSQGHSGKGPAMEAVLQNSDHLSIPSFPPYYGGGDGDICC